MTLANAGITAADFEDNEFADFKVTVSRTPVTTTFTGNGDEIRTDGTPANIEAVFHKRQPDYSQNEEGLVQTVSGYLRILPSQAMNRNDKITYNGNTYRITSVLPRGPAGDVVLYKHCELELIS